MPCRNLLALIVAFPASAIAVDPLPRFEAVPASKAESTFKTLGGFRMELLAAEPLTADPVAGVYDEFGRLFVAEMADYPYVEKKNDKAFTENKADPPMGRVRVLLDKNDDGRFDESVVFADGLSWPTGLAVWKGGLFVAATPDIWYLKDVDGDFKADIRQKIFTGFRKFNVQAVLNNLAWGPDHKLYGAASGNGGLVRSADRPGANPIALTRQDFRIDPTDGSLEPISGGARFGNTFDDYGNRFLCDIRNPLEHVVLPARYLSRNPFAPAVRAIHDAAVSGDAVPVFRASPPEPWRVLRANRWADAGKVFPRSELNGSGFLTSSSGVTIYRGSAYPKEYLGNMFLGEVSGNLIHRQLVEPDGVTFRARRVEPDKEAVASSDTWFRPVNFIHAPDGTLHVLDMYRETIEHPWSIPDDIHDRLNLRSGDDRGRVYRLAPPNFRREHFRPPGTLGTRELVALLEHPNAWHRDTAQRLLFERQDPQAAGPVRALLSAAKSPVARFLALHSLEGLGVVSREDLLKGMTDDSPRVRELAVMLAESRFAKHPELLHRTFELSRDPDARVRFQTAFSLGESADPRRVARLAEIAVRDAGDPWITAAILSSSKDIAVDLHLELVKNTEFLKKPESTATLRGLAFIVGYRNRPEDVSRVLFETADPPQRAPFRHTEPFLETLLSLAEGLEKAGVKLNAYSHVRYSHKKETLADFLKMTAEIAVNPVYPLDRRERFTPFLAHLPFDRAFSVAERLLDEDQPPNLRRLAVKSLRSFADAKVAYSLLNHWNTFTPALRNEALDVLCSRPAFAEILLASIEAKTVSPEHILATRKSFLLNHPSSSIRARAAEALGGRPGPRGEVVARYLREIPARGGDRETGLKVYERECAACHKVGPRGHAIGPNLASMTRRTPEELLIHILDPDLEVAPDYVAYAVELHDGRTQTGIVVAETSTGVTIGREQGVRETYPRSSISELRAVGKSFMPDGLETKITPAEMNDLLAFLLELQK